MKIFVLIVISVASLYSLEPLVNSLWLQENINDSNIRIIDVSDGFQYTYEHIPGAVNSSVDKWRFDNGSFLSIRPVVDIEKEIRRLGINEHTNVVLYAPINEQRPLLNVSYVYWALNYHGIKNVRSEGGPC